MKRHHCAIFAGLYVCAGVASAASNDPGDAATAVPPAVYLSSFADYHALGEDMAKPWAEANDTVRAIGGWRVYAKEAAEAARAKENNALPAAPAAPVTAPALPAPPPHPRGG